MHCKGCGKDKKLIKTHAIPESFFKRLRSNDRAPNVITNTTGVYPKKSPIGIYDQEVLCHDCENHFQRVDDYGHKLLINKEGELEKLIAQKKLLGYRINGLDYELLKMFFVSVLWRASISKKSFYSKVKLGKYESIAKSMIWGEIPCGEHDFSFVLAKYDDDSEVDLKRSMLDPHTERFFKIRYYRIYMYGYILYIKADSQKTPVEWEGFIPKDGNLIIISRGIFKDSKEYPLLVDIANNRKS